MTDYYRPENMQKSRGRGKWMILVVFVVTGMISLGLGVWGMAGEKQKKGLFGELHISYVFDEPKNLQSSGDAMMVQKIKDRLAQESGSYAVYVNRLSERSAYGFNETAKMPAMSTAKVPVMVATYQAIEQGKLNLGDLYSVTEDDVDNLDEQSDPAATMAATPAKKVVQMTVGQMLTAMGQRSDNAAAGVVIGVVGKANILKVMANLGMKDSVFDDNETTAQDVATMWTKLYQNKDLISQAHKDEMWNDLQDSIFEDRIAVGIPSTAKLVHKVGTDENVWIDSGIIESEKPFVLVILNTGVDLEAAKKAVPEVTKMIWEYESARP